MKFNGNFEVTRTLTAKDAVTHTKTTVGSSLTTGGSLTVKPNTPTDINFSDKKVSNTFSGDEDTALVNQKYVHEAELKALPMTVAPSDVNGKDKDVCFEGVLEDVVGDYNEILPHITSAQEYINDGTADGATTMILKKYQPGNDSRPHTIRISTDGGKTFVTRTRSMPVGKGGTPIMDSGKPHHFIAYHGDPSTALPPIYSTDDGYNWSKASIPSGWSTYGPSSVAKGDIVILRGYNTEVLYSHDAGKTYHKSNFKWHGSGMHNSGVMSIVGDVIIGISQDGYIAKSTDKGVTWTKQTHKLENLGNIYSLIALSEDEWLFTSTHGHLQYTKDGGRTVDMLTVPWDPKYIRLGYNDATGAIVMTNMDYVNKTMNTGYTTRSDLPTIHEGTMDDYTVRPAQTYTAHEFLNGVATFIGYPYSDINTKILVTLSDTGHQQAKEVGDVAGITDIHARHEDTWIKFAFDPSKEADATYLKKEGGEVGALTLTGDITMNNKHAVVITSPPVDPSDLVPKSYIDDKVSAQSGTKFNYTITNTPITIDTTAGSVETIRYTVSAKNGNDQYFSQINVIANGTDDPVSAEFGVIIDGALDIDFWVEKAGDGSTLFKAKANKATTALRVKREIIDI